MKDLSLYMLDLAQNSVRAGAHHLVIEVDCQPEADCLSFSLADDGSGMDEATLKRVQDPFYTTQAPPERWGSEFPFSKRERSRRAAAFP